jgi:hypothetical protein
MPDTATQLADRIGIGVTTALYVETVDGGDIDGFVALFADDGILHPHGLPPSAGRERIREFLTSSRASRPTGGSIRHNVSSERIRLGGGDSAEATSYFLAMGVRGPDHWGTYHDELIKVDGEWLFRSRTVTIEGADPDGWIGSGAGPVKFAPSGG